MKRYKITYQETRQVSVEIEARTTQDAYDKFHNLDIGNHGDLSWNYSNMETEVAEVPPDQTE